MDESKAHGIIAALASGVDPLTGKVFAADSPYQAVEIVRALYIAAHVLEARLRNNARSTGGRVKAEPPANAGKPWNDAEDQRLLTEFDSGRSVAELARAHLRTVAAIQARLESHGRLQLQSPPRLRRVAQRTQQAAADRDGG